jgi:voltage-gated potassium channel
VVSFLDVMLRDQSGTLRVEEITVGDGSPWVGKKIKEIDLHGRYELLPLAMRKPDGEMKFNPRDDTTMASGDVLVVMGDVNNVWKARDAAGNKVPHRAV